jgi:hypothetical protein
MGFILVVARMPNGNYLETGGFERKLSHERPLVVLMQEARWNECHKIAKWFGWLSLCSDNQPQRHPTFALGQPRRLSDVRGMSASPPIPDVSLRRSEPT